MRTYIDHQKVNGRATAANFASVGGLLVLLSSVLIPLFLPRFGEISWILTIVGAGIAMVGIYLANRWVRKPRPEESLDAALRSFDDHYQLYHYPALPCEHVLLTPAGVIALQVFNLAGIFSYRNGRWKEALTIGRALRYIVEPRVEDPVVFSQQVIEELGDRFRKVPLSELPVPIKALTVFTHKDAVLEIVGSAIPACKLVKLRNQAKIGDGRLAPETYERLSAFLQRSTLG